MNTASIFEAGRAAGLVIVYDGECPFCSSYVQVLALREAAGTVRLVDARSHPAFAAELQGAGYDLNQGMVLFHGGSIYHGAECVHRLALLSTSSGLFNRINGALFRSRTLSRIVYPVLRCGRNITLRILRRRPLQ